jgi:hypothetical protein
MAISVKLSLYEGTDFTRGFGDRRADQCVIHASVEGMSGTNNAETNLRIAEEFAVAAAGTTASRFGDPTLYLDHANGHRITDEKADVYIRYGRPQSSPPILPGTANVDEVIEWVFDTVIGTSFSSYTPYPFTGPPIDTVSYYGIIRPVPMARLRLHTVLSDHPGTNIDLLVGSSNSDTFTMGRPRAPNTLRFDGAQITPIPIGGTTGSVAGIKYAVTYVASYKKTGWYRLEFFFGAFPATATVPAPLFIPQFGTIAFSGVLPLHG